MALNPNCYLIAVVGGKGGVGKSVFAANLAFAIQNEMRQPTLLIDADSKSCGDQNIITGLRPVKTISELATYAGSINASMFPQVFAQHPSGLNYLAACRGPEEVISVQPDVLMAQIESLSKSFRFIVVDLGNDLGPLQHAFLEEATAITVITAPEVLVNNQTQRLIGELIGATIPVDMIQLVVNKSSNAGLSPQAISQSLRLPILAVVPQDDTTTINAVKTSIPFVIGAPKAPITAAYFDLVRRLTGGILQKLKTLSRPKSKAPDTNQEAAASLDPKQDPLVVLKLRIHSELIKAMDLKKGITETNGDPTKEKSLRQKTQQTISAIVDREGGGLSREERSKVIKEVLDEALGLGPLEDMLADPDVSEIMVNGANRIFVEKKGKVELQTTVRFTSNLHLRNVIERIVTPLGRRIDERTPYVDARLKDGSRVNAIIEPLSIDGPSLTIRKFKKDGVVPEKYVEWGSMTKPMLDFMRICVNHRLNVIISGGTGSGKTTLLNMLSGFIRSDLRIITVEDAAELQLKQAHVVRLETRPANMEGTGAITIRDLIKNTLRMRPDVIVVGETRDGAALDMLQAMNTGHDGSMTTTHANSPRECIGRLETLCLMAGMDLPSRAIREQVSKAINIIIQISRMADGSRKITSITEVSGMQGDVVTLTEIFRFKETGFDRASGKVLGEFQALGRIPKVIEELQERGVDIPRDIFTNDPNVMAVKAPAPQPKTTMPKQQPIKMPNMNMGGIKKASGDNGGGS